jgi:hypothetical protein
MGENRQWVVRTGYMGNKKRDLPPENWPSEGVRSLMMREGRDAEGQDAYRGADHSGAA